MKRFFINIPVVILSLTALVFLVGCGGGDEEEAQPQLSKEEVEQLLNANLLSGKAELTFSNGLKIQFNSDDDVISLGMDTQLNEYNAVALSIPSTEERYVVGLNIQFPPLQNGTYSMNDIRAVLTIQVIEQEGQSFTVSNLDSSFQFAGSLTAVYKLNEVHYSFEADLSDTSGTVDHVSGFIIGRPE